MKDDLIGRAEAQTAIQFAAKRYTVAHEAHGEGQVVWSDNLINVTDAMNALRDLPPVQQDEKLEKCKFEYINACRIVTNPTPDTTKKDIYDAYAVIKVLQPIFGDVTF